MQDDEVQLISGETGHKYFHMMLNMAEDELGASEYRLLGHYLRWAGHGGSIREGIRQTADHCQMDVKTVRTNRQKLADKRYIIITEPTEQERSGGIGTKITVLDRWKENIDRYTSVPKLPHPVVDFPTPPVGKFPHNEEQEEEQYKRYAPEQNSGTLEGIYGAAKRRQPARVEGQPEGSPTSSRRGFTDPATKTAVRLIGRFLKAHGADISKGLSETQYKTLGEAVMTVDRGRLPSPIEEAESYPIAWQAFMDGIEQMPYWKKRVGEQGAKVTAGLVIDIVRGYHWIGGWLEYRPDGQADTETGAVPDLGF